MREIDVVGDIFMNKSNSRRMKVEDEQLVEFDMSVGLHQAEL